MEPVTFLIAILGCGEAEAPCNQVRMLETPYRSQAACSAATDEALLRNSDADYPVVVARCVAANARAQVLKADVLKANQVERPGPGSVHAAVSPLRR